MRSLGRSIHQKLIEPPDHIQGSSLRHRSRLLNIVLIPLIALFLAVDISHLLTTPDYLPLWYGYVILFASYILNHSRAHKYATFLILVMFPVVILTSILIGQESDPIAALYYLIPGVILCGILLPTRETMIFSLIEITLLHVFPFIAPRSFPTINEIIGPVYTLVVTTVLVLVSVWFRDQMEKDREEVIRKAEEKYRHIVENAIDGIFQSTREGRFLNVNPSMARMYGYDSPEDMIQSITNISSQLYVEPAVRKILIEILEKEKKITGFESLDYRKDGSTFWTSMNVQAILDDSGNLKYYEGTVEDITKRKHAEEVLRESEERYRALFNRILDGLYRSTHEGQFLDVNPAMVHMFGYASKEEMMGVDIAKEMYFSPEEREDQTLGTGEEQLVNEFRMRRKDGSEIWVEDHGHYIRDRAGKVIYHEGILRDITERRQSEIELRDNQQRLQAFFDQSLDGFFFTMFDEPQEWENAADKEKVLREIFSRQKYTDVNNALLEQYGIDREKFLSLTSSDIFAHDIKQGLNLRRDLFDRGRLRTETHELKMDGTSVWFEGEYVCLYDEKKRITGFFGIQRDVTNRKLGELEREELIRQLESKNTELERFTYTISHDLKSPLVTINGFLGYLKSDTASGKSERVFSDIQRIQDAVDKMHQLLKDLLELSRIGRIINPPENIEFELLARDALEIVHGRIEAQHANVQILPGLPAIHGDRQRLMEVLQNLIDNAAKYMGSQPSPQIKIGQRGQEGGRLVFYVQDNGIGIAPEHLDRVFGLFNKLDPQSDGTGVGLALVKRIIEVHGGRVWVESEVGRGSTFLFTLSPHHP